MDPSYLFKATYPTSHDILWLISIRKRIWNRTTLNIVDKFLISFENINKYLKFFMKLHFLSEFRTHDQGQATRGYKGRVPILDAAPTWEKVGWKWAVRWKRRRGGEEERRSEVMLGMWTRDNQDLKCQERWRDVTKERDHSNSRLGERGEGTEGEPTGSQARRRRIGQSCLHERMDVGW